MGEWDRHNRRSGPAPQDDAESLPQGNDLRQRALMRRMQQRRNGDGPEAQQLDPVMRQRAEKSLGVPLDDVRVHTGADAEQANAQMGSKAFAVGSDVVLGSGVENSANPILAHEVAHTVQQQGGALGVAPKMERDPAGSAHERDADQAAERVMLGLPARVSQLGAPRVQCFDSYEHVALGNAGGGGEKVRVARGPKGTDEGLEIEWGEAVALSGDFFASPEALMHANPGEVQKVLAIFRRQKAEAAQHGGQPTSKEAAENDKGMQEATAWRERAAFDRTGHATGQDRGEAAGTEKLSYLGLADKNSAHFSPDNLRGQYMPRHKQALELARQAHSLSGAEKQAKLDEARAIETFGVHFLTDAFASGHLLSGETGREAGGKFWDGHQGAIMGTLTGIIEGQKEQLLKRMPPGTPVPSAETIAAGVAKLMGLLKDHAPSLCLKLVHDYLNENGVVVSNHRGDPAWHTYGDCNLSKAPETQKYAGQAVDASRRELNRAAEHGMVATDYEAIGFVPHMVTFEGKRYTVEEFVENRDIFVQLLRPRLLNPSPENPLYCLIKGNLGMIFQQAGEWADKKEEGAAAGILRGANAVERAGHAVERAGAAVGHAVVGEAKQLGEGFADYVRASGDGVPKDEKLY